MRALTAFVLAGFAWVWIRAGVLIRFWRSYPAELVVVIGWSLPCASLWLVDERVLTDVFGDYATLVLWLFTAFSLATSMQALRQCYQVAEYDYRYPDKV
jgi:hypothetical protein